MSGTESEPIQVHAAEREKNPGDPIRPLIAAGRTTESERTRSGDYLALLERCSHMKMQAIITGKRVHGVGYRVFLLQSSLELGFWKFNAKIGLL